MLENNNNYKVCQEADCFYHNNLIVSFYIVYSSLLQYDMIILWVHLVKRVNVPCTL